jgi:hypothetical protein
MAARADWGVAMAGMAHRRMPAALGTALAVLLAALPVVLVAVVIVRDSGPTGPDRAKARSLFAARGQQVADAWQALPSEARHGGFSPLQALTVVPANLPKPLDTYVSHGAYWLRTELPSPPAGPGQVRFAGKEPMAVPLVTAGQAFSEINKVVCAADRPLVEPGQPDQSGKACFALPVTDVRLGEMPMQTTRGPATAPAWLFTVPGLPTPIARVAVSPEAITQPQPPLSAMSPRLGAVMQVPMVVDHVDGATVYYWFDLACHRVVGALAHETTDVVVLGIQVEPPRRGVSCAAVVVPQLISVTLAAPVGRRLLFGVDGALEHYATPRQREQLAESG